MTIVSDVEIRLRADIARLQQDMTQARRSVDTALGAMGASAQALKGLLAGLAAGFSAGAFVSFIKNSIDAADAINDLSIRTKVAIEDLGGLAYAAKLEGTSLEGVASAISKLGVNVGKEGEKFRQLGISATDPLEAFKQLADIFKDIQDPQQRAAFGAETLGKSWQEAAILLEDGSAGITALIDRGKELSGVTEQTAAAAAKFNDGLDTLGFVTQGVGTRIAAGLLPMLNVLVDDFTATGKSADTAASFVAVLSAAFKVLYTAGVLVATQLSAVGTAIGATAAAIAAAAGGDFKGAATIMRSAGEDIAASWVTAGERIGKAWTATSATAEKEGAAVSATAAKTAAKVATFLNSSEIKAARDKAAAEAEAAAKKEQQAYATVIASIKEKMAADQMEIDGAAAITPVQQARIKLDAELAAKKIILTAAHDKSAHALLDEAEALEKNAAAAKQVRAAVAALADERDASYSALVAEAAANEDLVATYGKTKLQIMQMTLARDEDRLARRGELELMPDTVAQLEREIAARKRNIAAMDTLGTLEAQTKANDEAAAAQKEFWKSIDDTAHDTFVSILDGNKNLWQRMKDSAKSVFFEWLYQMTIKKWIINIGTTISGAALSSAASASTGGASGPLSVASIYSSAKAAYAAIGEGFAGIGTAVADGVQSILYATGQSATILTNSAAATAAGVAAQYVAGLGAGKLLGSAVSGQYGIGDHGSAVVNISAIAGAFLGGPIGGAIGGAIGGLLNRAFGMGSKNVTNTSLTGTLTPTSASVSTQQAWTQKGGWFRSDKSGTDVTALDATQNAAFASTYKAILDVSKVLGDTIGADTAALSTRVQQLKIDLTGITTAADQQAAVVKFFAGVGDTIASELVPNLAAFQTEGEALSATLQRVVTNYATLDVVLESIGDTFGAVGVSSIEARERLIAAAGGLDALASGVSYFQQNFLTEAEQLAPVQKHVADTLAAMGMAGVTTTEQFKAAAMGLDLTTAAGADLFAKMLALAPSFKTVADAADAAKQATEELAAAQVEAAKAAAKAAADAKAKQLSDNETLLRGQVGDALSQLKAAINARKTELKAAFDGMMEGFASSIDKWSTRITDLKSLSSLLSGAKVGATQSAASREAAQAQIETALAVAKASGVLPSADSLRDAISAVTADSSSQFATLIEYQRDQQRAARSIAGLSGMTEDQLSAAEKTLLVLQDQKAAAQAAYDRQISGLDMLVTATDRATGIALGTYQGVLSVDAGIATVAAAIAALNLGATTSNPTGAGLTVADLYAQVLGRQSDAAGLDFWTKAFGGVVDAVEYASFIAAAAPELEAKANGTWTQWLAEHGAGGTAPQTQNTNAMQIALDTLNTQMASMQTAMTRTANSTQQLAQQFDAVSAGGNALFTESA